MAIATLTVDLVAKLGAIEQDLGRLGTVAQRQADQISGAFAGVRSTLAGLGVATTIGGMVAAFKTAADALDRLNDAADATGASIESLSKLENVARRNGAGIELVETAVLKMNKALSASDEEGKGAAAVLKALGLNADELKRQDPAIALQKVAVAFNQFERDGNLARAAQELFGKSIAEVAPFLKDLAEAGTLNATVTAEQAQAAETFNKQLAAMQSNVGDVARSITADMLPAINGLLEKVGAFANVQDPVGAFVSSTMRSNRENIGELNEVLERAVQSRDRLLANPGRGLPGDKEIADLDSTIARVKSQIELFKVLERQAALANAAALGDTAGERFANRAPRALNIPEPPKKSARQKQIDAETEALLRQFDIESRLVKQAEVEWDRLQRDKQDALDELIGRVEDEEQARERANSAIERTRQQYEDLIDPLARYRRLLSEIDQFELRSAANAELASGARAAVSIQMQQEAERLNGTLVQQNDIGRQLGLTFASAFEDAVLEGENFRNVLQAIGKDIARLAIRKTITEPAGTAISAAVSGLFGGGTSSSGGSGLGSQVGSQLVSQAAGGVIGNGFLAAGGSSLLAGTSIGAFATGAGTALVNGVGIAGNLSAAGSLIGTGTMSGIMTGIGMAAPYIAAVVALVAALSDFKGGTPHAGAVVFGSQTGSQSPSTQAAIDAFYRDPRQNQQFHESDFTKRYNKGIADALSPVAENLAQVFNKITTEFGAGSGFKVGLGFSADGEDKSRGRFSILDAAGNEITDFLRKFSKDAATGMQQFGVAAQQGLIAGLREVDLGGTVNAVLDKSLQGSTDYLTRLSQDQTAALLGLLEGGMLDELFQNVDLASTSWDGINQRIVEFSRVAQLDPLFDRLGISITEFGVDIVGALGGLESAAGLLQQVIDFQSVQADAANLFAGSIRNIKFGVLDDPGKYEFLDKEANRFRDVLASLSDVTLIQDYAAKLNDTINTAFNILSPEQQALYAEDFITRLESASQLTQDRLLVANESRDKIFEQLPDKIEQAVRDGLKPVADAMVTAAREGRTIDIRLPAGLEVG